VIDKKIILPFYAKASLFFVGLLAFFTMLYIAQGILVPIVLAIIIAIVLHPIIHFFVRRRINKVVAIVMTLLLTLIAMGAFGTLIFSQASRFSESLPTLVEKLTGMLNQTVAWASGYFNIDSQNIYDWISKTKGELINTSSAAIGQMLHTVGSLVFIVLLVPIYVFLILFYEPILLEFIRRILGVNNKTQVNEIITQTKTLIQRYIVGLLFEAAIVATLYSVGLLIIGIDYAIILGCIAALLNIIPYIGGLIAVSLIMLISIATKDSATYPLLVAGLAIIIHLIDNSFIIPKTVASKVKINAFVSVTAIIAASALFGIPGMIICIPIIGIVKLIFDHIEPLKPWGFLLGNTMPSSLNIKPIRTMRIKKKPL
jgi:predicted PurR-regulated permease PerM